MDSCLRVLSSSTDDKRSSMSLLEHPQSRTPAWTATVYSFDESSILRREKEGSVLNSSAHRSLVLFSAWYCSALVSERCRWDFLGVDEVLLLLLWRASAMGTTKDGNSLAWTLHSIASGLAWCDSPTARES